MKTRTQQETLKHAHVHTLTRSRICMWLIKTQPGFPLELLTFSLVSYLSFHIGAEGTRMMVKVGDDLTSEPQTEDTINKFESSQLSLH